MADRNSACESGKRKSPPDFGGFGGLRPSVFFDVGFAGLENAERSRAENRVDFGGESHFLALFGQRDEAALFDQYACLTGDAANHELDDELGCADTDVATVRPGLVTGAVSQEAVKPVDRFVPRLRKRQVDHVGDGTFLFAHGELLSVLVSWMDSN